MGAPEAEMQELLARIEEADALLRAVQDGEVDAFVVGRREEDRHVVVLSDAALLDRRLVSELCEGAAIALAATGEILFANPALGRLLGVDPASLEGTRLESHAAPASRAALRALLAGAGGRSEAELDLTRADGSVFSARVGVVRSESRVLTALVSGADEDVEVARQTLDAISAGSVDALVVEGSKVVLLESEAPYRVIVEHMREGAFTVRADGQVDYANQQLASMVGVQREQLRGAVAAELVDERDRATFGAMSVSRTGTGEIRLRGRVDRLPVMQATAVPVNDQTLFLFSDITRRKRHETSDALTRRFLGLLAQELGGSFRQIDGALEALEQASADSASLPMIETIRREMKRVRSLVDDLARINPPD